MKLQHSQKLKTLQNRSSFAIIVIAAVLIEATSVVQYWFARKGIQEEVQHRAQSELQVKNLEIQKVLTAVEVAANNMVWAIEQQLARPDSIQSICRRLVEQNPNIVGCGIGFVADYYPQHGRWFEPYVAQHSDGTLHNAQIGSPTHDYLQAEWFLSGMAAGKGLWSEPYFDNAGAKMMLSTYTLPVRDPRGNTVAILGADVSLDWLSSVINAYHIYPSSYNLMISRQGQLMACPVESLVMRRSIEEATAGLEDTTARTINREMMSGQSGRATVIDENGEKNYVFYAPLGGDTGWSMAVVCSDREIFYSLRQVGFNLFLLMIFGLVLLGIIIRRTARGEAKLFEVRAEKQRIASELRIASNIQKGMLPKIFPAFPERDDVEIHGTLMPAKEVGGDLYDFFIRDEKLFFCIGDVSGKGVPASLVMAVTRSLFRTISTHESAPDRIVTTMNEAMAEMNEENMFVTLFIGVLDLPTGRLRYCNAGHCPPILSGADTEELHVEANLPLALMTEWKFVAQETLIAPHTTLFLYTDGLTEAEDADHHLFGEQRMMDVISQAHAEGKQTSEDLIDSMKQAVDAYVGDAEQSDDLTMLVIQYTKEQRDVRLLRTLTLDNDVKQVEKLATFVDGVCEEMGFDMALTMQLNLAIEEAVVNVMNYAYPAGTTGKIDIEAQANDVRIKFTITDSGIPFDPTAKEEIDTSLSAEERPIGGLGIHLVRQLMDSINYERTNGHNVLTLRKKLAD